jgi:hypothetical protein
MTAQVHERLILEGKQTSMIFCPPIPKDHPQIVELTEAEVDRRMETGDISPFIHSTACWRRYIGTWELRDGRLYLVQIEGQYYITGETPIFADWVTAVLRIPEGERIHYVHMGFGSVYEFEIHLKIEQGLVMEERRIDNRGKDVNPRQLGWDNLPGGENKFDGDDMK